MKVVKIKRVFFAQPKFKVGSEQLMSNSDAKAYEREGYVKILRDVGRYR